MTQNIIKYLVCTGCLFVFLFTLSAGQAAHASPRLQSFCDEGQWFAYIPDVREEQAPATVQVANEDLFFTQTQNLADVPGAGIHTILLFDNSFSISEQNRTVMKEAAMQIIHAHAADETYSLATFDDSLHILAQESSDYPYVMEMTQNIGYADQPTFLKDALYTAWLKYGREEKKYRRFVVFSDGCDDNRLGYTYEELRELFLDRQYPVYVVGSWYEADPQGLSQLFSFSRSTGGACFLLDEMEDLNAVTERLSEDAPLLAVEGQIPLIAQDGGMKDIRISVEEENEEKIFHVRSRMPFADMQLLEAQEAEIAFTEDAPTEKETEDAYSYVDVTQPGTERFSEQEPPAGTEPPKQEDLFVQETAVLTPEPGYPAEEAQDPVLLSETDPDDQQEERSFLERESLLPGIKNLYICAGLAAAAGVLAVLMFGKRKKSGETDTGPEEDFSFTEEEEQGYGTEQNADAAFSGKEDATMLLKNYPGPQVVRFSDAKNRI